MSMASRKSSILKPRKVREPLQDLNQLLPNNDEEETTTTDAQKRKVSFASMNKVKEFETVAECVLLNTPAYDERFPISSDSYQSSACGRPHTESMYQVNVVSNISRKSIPMTFKTVVPKQSINMENIDVDEDIELTEANGRIYDIPMKSSGDSSMEMTNILSQSRISCLIDCEEIEEVVCPGNEKADSDTSSMETTEVISAELIRSERSDVDTSSMETTDVIYDNALTESVKGQSMFYETEQFDDDNDVTESVCDEIEYVHVRKYTAPQTELIPPRKSIFEMGGRKSMAPGSWVTDRKSIFETDNILPLQNDTPNLYPLKYYESVEISSFEISDDRELDEIEKTNNEFIKHNKSVLNNSQVVLKLPQDCGNNGIQHFVDNVKYNKLNQLMSQEFVNKTKYNNSSMQLQSQEIDNKSKYDNSSMKLMNQDTDNKIKLNSTIQILSQEVDSKTNYCNSSKQLPSQEIENKTKYSNFCKPLLSQEENKTRYSNPSMQLMSQETDYNKTKYNNSSMQLLSQETYENKNLNNSSIALSKTSVDKTKFDNSSMHLTEALQAGILKEDFSHVIRNSNKHALNKIEVDGTEFENSSMHFTETLQPGILKEDFVKTNQNTSNTHQTKFDNSNIYLTEGIQALNKTGVDNPELNRSNMNLTETLQPDFVKECFPETDPSIGESLIPSYDKFTVSDKPGTGEIANVPATSVEVTEKEVQPLVEEEYHNLNDVQEDIGQKSMVQNNSSASDSNSPLTVGVNFSIFQKNKETRVEFSGTIDSNKKKKSISNVQVNIINNKVEKQNRNVKELRFSMPAARISPDDGNKRPDFHATFTDFSVPYNEKNLKPLPNDNVNEHVDNTDIEKIIKLCSNNCDSLNIKHNEDSNLICLSKPTKKRLSSEVLEDDGKNKSSSVKRRSMTNDIQFVNKVQSACTENMEYAVKRDCLVQQDITEITRKRESFVREEKSILSVNNKIHETCAKSTNLNISYEARHVITSPDQLEKVLDLKGDSNSGNKESSASSENENKVRDRSPVIRSDNSNNQPFIAVHSTPYCKSQSMNQSQLEDEMTINSLHNPSIIVNVGDSMDLGPDNFSMINVRESPERELDVKNLIENIASDNICRENFVVDWLENKTGRNMDSRLVERSNITTTSCQSVLNVNQNNAENTKKQFNVEDNKISSKKNVKIYVAQDNTKNDKMQSDPLTVVVPISIDSESEKVSCATMKNVVHTGVSENVAQHSAVVDISVPSIQNLSLVSFTQEKQLESQSVALDEKDKSCSINAEEIMMDETGAANLFEEKANTEIKITKENAEINNEQNVMIFEKSKIREYLAIDSSPLIDSESRQIFGVLKSQTEQSPAVSNHLVKIYENITKHPLAKATTQEKCTPIAEEKIRKANAQQVERTTNCTSENVNITSIEDINISIEKHIIYNESNENEPSNSIKSIVTDVESGKNLEVLTLQGEHRNMIINNDTQFEVFESVVTQPIVDQFIPSDDNHSLLSSEVLEIKKKSFTSLIAETKNSDELASAKIQDTHTRLKESAENCITEEIIESVDDLMKHVTLNVVDETKPDVHQIETSFEDHVSSNNLKVSDRLSLSPINMRESLEQTVDHTEIGKKEATSSLKSTDMDIEEIIFNETNATSFNSDISIEEKFEEVKMKCKNKSTEIIEKNDKLASGKRQKMTPDFENYEYVLPIHSRIEPVTLPHVPDDALEKRSSYKSRPKYQWPQAECTRQEILKKIKKESHNNSGWSLKTVTNNEWVFDFFFGYVELTVKFNGEESRMKNCIPTLKYVHPEKFKEFEILKISVDSFIKKYEVQMKNNVCQRVEDVPFLLDWVNKRINRLKHFVTDMMKLADFKGLKFDNGKTSFYISSYRNHLFFKVEVNIKRLENLSIDDIKVMDKIGKADINLIRNVFTEVGQEMSQELNQDVAPIFFSFSKFVKNLWETFDPKKKEVRNFLG